MERQTQRDTATIDAELVDGTSRVEYMPLHEVVRWERNPKDHDLGLIHGSIRRFGFISPLLVNEATGVLVAGHGRLDTLQQMFEANEPPPKGIIAREDGEWLVPVLRGVSFRDDIEAAAFAIADNRVTEAGGWNDPVLADVLKELHSHDALYSIGYDGDDLDALLKSLATDVPTEEDPQEEEDESDRDDRHNLLLEKWGCASGQLWIIPSNSLAGRKHRILCGDSTDPNTWDTLMDGTKGQVLITSPPYGVGKEYEEEGHEKWAELIRDVFSMSVHHVGLAAVNLADVKVGPNGRELHTYGDLVSIMEMCGYPLIGTRIWTKNPAWLNGQYWVGTPKAVDDYEYIGLFGDYGKWKQRLPEGTEWRYRGVWDFGSVAKNDLHPAAFPVELPSRLIQLLSDKNATIVEPFLGSGTTMVAAEQLGRLCFGIERDPRYLAVTLERLEQMGLHPRLQQSAEMILPTVAYGKHKKTGA